MKQYVKLYENFKKQPKSNFLQSTEDITSWLEEMGVENYTINPDFTVDVAGDVQFMRTEMKALMVKFGKVTGNFILYGNMKMKNCKGCPEYVGGDFKSNYQYGITSLEGFPKIVKGNIDIWNNIPLTSLVFIPKKPNFIDGNKCTYIYKNLGFKTEAHVEALLTLDPKPKQTLSVLKVDFPERYDELISNEKIKNLLSSDSESKTSIGGGFLPIEEWDGFLKVIGVKNYTINKESQIIDVDGDVKLNYKGLKDIPVRFGKVTGYFDCSNNQLTSLKGCPAYVGDSFSCGNNKLTSLEYGPIEVGSGFDCSSNKLTSLEYSPKNVGWLFICNTNKLTSFVFACTEPGGQWNPCYKIYKSLGFTTEAHVEALLTLDPNPKETIEKLKVVFPERYDEIIQNERIQSIL